MELTQVRIKELLNYDPDTGVFTWKPRDRSRFSRKCHHSQWNNKYAGKPAGSVHTGARGYKCVNINIDYRLHKAHRLAWIYMTGEQPPKAIDHKDRDGTNNRWSNLRDGTGRNSLNMSMRRNNTSGICGVSWSPLCKRWYARAIGIRPDGKRGQVYLGLFDTIEQAAEAVDSFRIANGYEPDHGKSLPVYA